MECPTANLWNTIWNGDVCHAASSECVVANNSSRNGNVSSFATEKCIVANLGDTPWDGYVFQFAAAGECVVSDFNDTFWDGDACQVNAILKCTASYLRNRAIKNHFPCPICIGMRNQIRSEGCRRIE